MKIVNHAAWIPAEQAPLEVDTAPFPDIAEDEVIIRNRAVAVNPVDWKIQTLGGFGIKYPYVLGEDVAGDIIQVGPNVKHLKRGQRVIAHALTLWADNVEYGGFQLYVRLKVATVAPIPDHLQYQSAVVLPVSISTAAAGLYLKTNLGLRLPQVSSETNQNGTSAVGKRERPNLLVWGGSSSVGSSVIQLAKASGYDVLATASPANYEYVKSLGATLVLDYHNPDVVSILIELFKAARSGFVGAYDAIGSETTVRQSASIVHALGGGVVASVVSTPDDVEKDVKVTRVGALEIVSREPEVARKVWGEYVPAALKNGTLLAKPEELVIGNDLEHIQVGLDKQKSGVSARKIVITL